MRSEQDCAAFAFKGSNQRPEITAGLGIKAGSWFVKEEEFGIADIA
jgi:hypothetical protein